MSAVAVGSPAPEFTLETAGGGELGLAALCADGPVVLVFLRHFG